jgi:hypothetical protein
VVAATDCLGQEREALVRVSKSAIQYLLLCSSLALPFEVTSMLAAGVIERDVLVSINPTER